MEYYTINNEVSFVIDGDKLVVLSFDTGDYYIVEGVCMEIILSVYKSTKNFSELLCEIKEKYDDGEYDLEKSLKLALDSLIDISLITLSL